MNSFSVGVLLLTCASQFVDSKDSCDKLAMKRGQFGPVLRVNVHIKECRHLTGRISCQDRFDFSLTRGELYRNTEHLYMMLFGKELCIVWGKKTEATQGGSFKCTSGCSSPTQIPTLPKEALHTCTNGVCKDVTKSYWSINMTKITLTTDASELIKPGIGIDGEPRTCDSGLDTVAVTYFPLNITFEDCVEVKSKSMEPVERCDEVGIYDERSKNISSKLVVKKYNGGLVNYNKLIMIGYDQYFLLGLNQGMACLSTMQDSRVIFKVSRFRTTTEEVRHVCKKSCIEIEKNESLRFMYYQQSWDKPSDDDLIIVKYIKIQVKYEKLKEVEKENGSKSGKVNFGNYVKSNSIVILSLIVVQLLY